MRDPANDNDLGALYGFPGVTVLKPGEAMAEGPPWSTDDLVALITPENRHPEISVTTPTPSNQEEQP